MASPRKSHGWSVAVSFCLGAGAVVTLLATTGLEPWRIKVLVIFAGVCFSVAAQQAGLFRAPTAIGIWPRGMLILAIIWSPLIYLGIRLMPPPRIKPLFQDSTFLTEARRDLITADINDFYDYLVKQVGLKMPPKAPTLGTTPGKTVTGAGLIPGADVETVLSIPEDRIDDRSLPEVMYAAYLFEEPLGGHDFTSPTWGIGVSASQLFSAYYVSSFNDRNLSPPDYKWGNALWSMRTKYGQSTMDSMMWAVFTTWRPDEFRNEKDFDTVFSQRLSYVSFLAGKPAGEVNGILKSEGIKTGVPK